MGCGEAVAAEEPNAVAAGIGVAGDVLAVAALAGVVGRKFYGNKEDYTRMREFRIRDLLFVLLGCTIFVRCASIAQPQGGPRDSLPPLVVGTVPMQRTVNFDGKRIVLNFNEYVALRDQQKEMLVSPPSPTGKQPQLTVKGRSIVVDFEEKPDSGTTYRIDFGNSIADNNEGNRLGNYAFIFSTGAELDTLIMSGLAVDAQTRDSVVGAMVFFFDAEADSAAYDSVMFNARARAIFRTDSSGLFLADILRDRDYRIYAMLDKNGNQRYEPGKDYIAMLDSVYNPTRMPDFDMWIDPAEGRRGPRRRIEPPQLVFELFLEEPKQRTMILEQKRPIRQQLQIVFNNRERQRIVSFVPEGIDSTWLRREDGIKGDTVWYWIEPPTKQEAELLPDTVRVRIEYMTQDSVWQPQVRRETLSFVHRVFDRNAPRRVQRSNTAYADSVRKVREERRRAKRAERLQKKWIRVARVISRRRGDPKRTDAELLADSTLFKQVDVDTTQVEKPKRGEEEAGAPNLFGFNVLADNPLIPDNHIRMVFDYPLRRVDSSRIRLTRLTAGAAALPSRDRQTVATEATVQKVEQPEAFTVDFDTVSRRMLTIRADWRPDEEYALLIPDSVFLDVAFQANDTLKSTFRVADTSRFGTAIIRLSGLAEGDSVPGTEYILEWQTRDGKTVRRVTHAVRGGVYKLQYLPPNRYRLRVTEDRNGNGEWDTGSLVDRRQPERIRFWEHPVSGRDILAKENWDVGVEVEVDELFGRF
ncbi:Ig-like domain-containing protein [uncultured Rikenella sp.]|uniref:Ig-like domain-containing protein n=1 Tax=uncultured Rikenella sp. TaxID=368003 RepID=UPI0025D9A629|nr:Ig-like domain-containing protein [uncultured Rikenella sp.]